MLQSDYSEIAKKFNIPLAKVISRKFHHFQDIFDFARNANHEGFVIFTKTQKSFLFLKLKSHFYMNLSRGLSFSESGFEKYLWILVLEQKYDDVKSFINSSWFFFSLLMFSVDFFHFFFFRIDSRKFLDAFSEELLSQLEKTSQYLFSQVEQFMRESQTTEAEKRISEFSVFTKEKEHAGLLWLYYKNFDRILQCEQEKGKRETFEIVKKYLIKYLKGKSAWPSAKSLVPDFPKNLLPEHHQHEFC